MKNFKVESTRTGACGGTVWVNTPTYCVARFGRAGQEIIEDPQEAGKPGARFETRKHENLAPTERDWEDFARQVQERFGIKIAKRHRPSYLVPTEIADAPSQLKLHINKLLASLTPRERKVLNMRFGVEIAGTPLQEVKESFEVTRDRIRAIEAKALSKLRRGSRSKRLKSFLP